MPAFSRLIGSLQNIRFNLPVIDVVKNELELENRRSNSDLEKVRFLDNIEFQNISFSYPRSDELILKNISFKINKGEFIGIYGESGSGKSTLIDIVCGLLKPSHGEILLDSNKLDVDKTNWQRLIGYVSQNVFLNDSSIKNNIAFGISKEKIDENRIIEVIKAVKLEEFIDSLPDGLDTVVGERGANLSGGQRQRISIARALYFEPSILIMDEPTSAIDVVTEADIIKEIYKLKRKITCMIVTHNSGVLSECDKLFEISHGRLKSK